MNDSKKAKTTTSKRAQNESTSSMPPPNEEDDASDAAVDHPPKRRRLNANDEPMPEPEPMEIEPPVNSQDPHSNASVEESTKDHVPTASTKSTTSAPSPSIANPTSRYVPQPPPTAEQVADLLLQPDPAVKAKKDIKVAPPKPPPPTPTPALSCPKQSDGINNATTAKSHTRNGRCNGQRRLLLRVVAFAWFVVMVKLALGFLVPNHVLWRQIRGAVASTTMTVAAFQKLIPSFLQSVVHANPPAAARIYPHVKPPNHVVVSVDGMITPSARHTADVLANLTLRDFLNDEKGYHLALAPAFFGIYAYVGTLMAWDEETLFAHQMKSVVGASAGAMAAVILAAGIEPHRVADLGKNMTLRKFADPPGIGGLFKGDKFEEIMDSFLRTEKPNSTLRMEDSVIPVAVTAFDLKSMQGRVLTRGSMAKAARASATFPVLFQPVLHDNGVLVDGGITDMLGLRGLAAWRETTSERPRSARVINLAVGGFMSSPPGPQSMPKGIYASEVLSISILNTPQCGPWAMANGPRAIASARRAMLDSLDLPLYHGSEKGHYELHVDAASYVE